MSPTQAADLLARAQIDDLGAQAAASLTAAGLVGICVNPDDALILELLQQVPSLRVLQLHGQESPARVAQIRRQLSPAQSIWKALHIGGGDFATQWQQYAPICELLLFDSAQIAPGHSVPGGSGQTFNWHILQLYQGALPFGLAGGITIDNIKDALAFRLHGRSALVIDIASGAELGIPGIKDIDKIRAMVAAVRETF